MTHTTAVDKLAARLRAARAALGLTQTQLAQLAGVSRVTISNTERGASIPSQDTVKRLSDALGLRREPLLALHSRALRGAK